jgi:hypothetical protein
MNKIVKYFAVSSIFLLCLAVAGLTVILSSDYYECANDLGCSGIPEDGCWSDIFPIEVKECIFDCWEYGYGWWRLGCPMK